MPSVEGFKKTLDAMKRLLKDHQVLMPSVVVGYTQKYAVYVHENLDAKHAAGKQAKFLESPARTMAPQLKKTIVEAVPKVGLPKALMLAGLQIQRASQEIVPIDTGALKASAFTKREK